MKNLLNLLMTVAVFWIGNEYFHPYLSIQDGRTLIIASVLMFVISFLFSLAMVLSVMLITVGIGCLTTPALMLASVILTPIKLWLLDKYLDGFAVHGFWTYVILTIVLSIFTVKVKSDRKD
ncbi:phage holin family protein [Paenibacillus doosanensis]|uniref:phage holin family protein n=1 Tax=Paenibacillus doosanensis TaxID=1229154 RepID=UPI00217F53BE|nr:phage holin family protein [Paenibacillus doosanensis]MCS7460855.1 phage holin family protein [Paenibacillus doosanensis]